MISRPSYIDTLINTNPLRREIIGLQLLWDSNQTELEIKQEMQNQFNKIFGILKNYSTEIIENKLDDIDYKLENITNILEDIKHTQIEQFQESRKFNLCDSLLISFEDLQAFNDYLNCSYLLSAILECYKSLFLNEQRLNEFQKQKLDMDNSYHFEKLSINHSIDDLENKLMNCNRFLQPFKYKKLITELDQTKANLEKIQTNYSLEEEKQKFISNNQMEEITQHNKDINNKINILKEQFIQETIMNHQDFYEFRINHYNKQFEYCFKELGFSTLPINIEDIKHKGKIDDYSFYMNKNK